MGANCWADCSAWWEYEAFSSDRLSSRPLPTNVRIKIYKTIILPVVLYGCETWSLTLREEHRLRVFIIGFIIGFCILLRVILNYK
jgi:hypothetical protein